MIRKRTVVLDAVILAVAGLVAITWFKGNYLIGGGDLLFSPGRYFAFSRYFYVWDDLYGISNPRITAGVLPYGLFQLATKAAGLSLVAAEQAWFYIIFTSSGLSMYVLASVMLGLKRSRFSDLASAFIYMFNPYDAVRLTTLYGLWLVYAFLPLTLALSYKGLVERRGAGFAIGVAALTSLITTSAFVNPAYVMILWLPSLLFLIFYLLHNRSWETAVSSLKFVSVVLASWFLFNVYWLLPDLSSLSASLHTAVLANNAVTPGFEFIFKLNSAPLSGAFRLLGYWALNSSFLGSPYFIWSPAYAFWPFILLGCLLPILSFSPILLRRHDTPVIFFSFFTALALLLVAGSYPPFGDFVLQSVLGVKLLLYAFTSPYLEFGSYLALGYSLLIGLALGILFNVRNLRLPREGLYKACALLLLFLIVGVYSFPMLNGQVIYPGSATLPSQRYRIPAYYQDASTWLNEQGLGYFVLSLPLPKSGWAAYSWPPGGYYGTDPTPWILNQTLTISSQQNGLAGYAAELLLSNATTEIGRLLSLMNVKYLMVHQDADFNMTQTNQGFFISAPLARIQSALASQVDVHLVSSIGGLDFYENDYWQPNLLYASTDLALVQGGIGSLVNVTTSDVRLPSPVVVATSDSLSAAQESLIPSGDSNVLVAGNSSVSIFTLGGGLPPSVNYTKASPVQYDAQISAPSGFYLVLSTPYDAGWTAYINGEASNGVTHFLANGFANGWFVNKTGTLKVQLYYRPQNMYYYGIAISGSSALLAVGLLSFIRFREERHQPLECRDVQKQKIGGKS